MFLGSPFSLPFPRLAPLGGGFSFNRLLQAKTDVESCQEVPRRARACTVRLLHGCSFSAFEVQVQFPTCLFCFVGSNLVQPILLAAYFARNLVQPILLAAYFARNFASRFCQALLVT